MEDLPFIYYVIYVFQIVLGDDLEYYYAVDNVTLEISPNVKTVKVDVYSIGPTVTLTDTKVLFTQYREWRNGSDSKSGNYSRNYETC